MEFLITMTNLSIIFICIGYYFMDKRLSRSIDLLQEENFYMKRKILELETELLKK